MDLITALRRLTNRVNGMVARAVIGRVNDTLKTQRLQLTILDGEVEDNVEHLQPYGVSFVPPAGAEVLALAVGGARSHTVGICASSPGTRPTSGAAGSGGLYTAGAWRVHIDPAGIVHVGAETGSDFVALAGLVNTNMVALKSAIAAAAVVATDGGAAFKANLSAALSAWPVSMAATAAKAT